MKRGLRYRVHKEFRGYIRLINKRFEVDDWFNGRFYIRIVSENFSTNGYTVVWELAFVDKFNPLNTYIMLLDTYYSDNHDINENGLVSRFAIGKINQALNSWIQYCDYGVVHDSPPNIHLEDLNWGYHSQRKFILEHEFISHKINPEKEKEFINKLMNAEFNTLKTNIAMPDKLTPNLIVEHYDLNWHNALSYEHITIGDWHWKSRYDNDVCTAVNFFDNENNFMFSILNQEGHYYIEYLDDIPNYKPNHKHRNRSMVAYEIDITKYNVPPVQCYLLLNGYHFA